jgi:hypothetical protein
LGIESLGGFVPAAARRVLPEEIERVPGIGSGSSPAVSSGSHTGEPNILIVDSESG